MTGEPPEISLIPIEELRADLDDTYGDIFTCESALKLGITTYGGGKSVRERLEVNCQIRDEIEVEIKRREAAKP